MPYEVKEFYDAETYFEYQKICSPLFRVPIPDLTDYDAFLKRFNSYEKDPEYLRLGSFDNGKLYAGVQFPWFTVNYDGHLLKMQGPGGVVSDFNQPYKGAIKQIFARAFEIMKQRGVFLSHVFPFADNYYRQFGYEVSCERALWEVPINGFKKFDGCRFVSFDNSHKMKEEIKDIYRCFSVKRNMSVARTEQDWDKFFTGHAAYKGNMYTYVSYTEHGADGFMCFSVKQREGMPPDFHVETCCFKTYAGLRGLLSYFATQTVYIGKVFLNLAADVDIGPLIDSRIGNENRYTHRKVFNAGCTRIVCVDEILKRSHYLGTGTVTIEIRNDAYCPWNNGCYTVSFGNETTVARGGTPDIQMDINAFSSGIMGRSDFDHLTIFPSVTIHGNEENLKKVFYKKPGWIEERY